MRTHAVLTVCLGLLLLGATPGLGPIGSTVPAPDSCFGRVLQTAVAVATSSGYPNACGLIIHNTGAIATHVVTFDASHVAVTGDTFVVDIEAAQDIQINAAGTDTFEETGAGCIELDGTAGSTVDNSYQIYSPATGSWRVGALIGSVGSC